MSALHMTDYYGALKNLYACTTCGSFELRSLLGTISGDAVNLTGGTATFNDKSVANGKLVTRSEERRVGKEASNYWLDSVSTTNANITALHLTGNFTARNKADEGNKCAPA